MVGVFWAGPGAALHDPGGFFPTEEILYSVIIIILQFESAELYNIYIYTPL